MKIRMQNTELCFMMLRAIALGISSFLISIHLAYGQQNARSTPVGFAMLDLHDSLEQIANMTLVQPCSACANANVQRPAVDCFYQNNSNEDIQVFSLEYDHAEEIPSELRRFFPSDNLENSDRGVTLMLALPNDNKGLGLWGMVRGQMDADDFGYTHGLKFSIGKQVYASTRFTIEGSTSLYSKRQPTLAELGLLGGGAPFASQYQPVANATPQLFTNENMIRAIVERNQKGKAFYWRGSLGFHQLDSSNFSSPLSASGQQIAWHNLLHSMRSQTFQYEYQRDGLGVRNGVVGEFFVGLAKAHLLGGGCRFGLQTFIEAGGRASTISGASTFTVEPGSTLSFQSDPEGRGARLTGSVPMTKHHRGVSINPQVSATYGSGNSWSTTLRYERFYGSQPNYQNYNVPREVTGNYEPMLTIETRIMIGR